MEVDQRRSIATANSEGTRIAADRSRRFSKAFKTKGLPALARYLTTYKRGDLVDIKADPSIQVGMPCALRGTSNHADRWKGFRPV